MSEVADWGAVVLAVIAVILAWVTYRAQRGKMRLEYARVAMFQLLPFGAPKGLKVQVNGEDIQTPTLTLVRLVNTGDKPIEENQFRSDLSIELRGDVRVFDASVTRVRPAELDPDVKVESGAVRLKPMLFNPGDMIEVQIMSSGHVSDVGITGRISGLTEVARARIPYPPGSGTEGEMILFDKIMWYGITPAFILGVGTGFPFLLDAELAAKVSFAAASAVISLVLYPMFVRTLVRRRRAWRP